MNNNQGAFIELIRGGLWEQNVLLSPFGKVDYEEVMHLAEEQSVVGLVSAGFEHVKDVKVPQDFLFQFIGSTLQIEKRNSEMNLFISELIKQLQKNGIYTLLIKGQGIAQCYERPNWRASGDVDLFLYNTNYNKAKNYLSHNATTLEEENKYLHFLLQALLHCG